MELTASPVWRDLGWEVQNSDGERANDTNMLDETTDAVVVMVTVVDVVI
jgi:hypothetical protein